MKFDDISWGRYPEKDVRKDQSEEFALIDEWREWNSDYMVCKNYSEVSKVKSSVDQAKNVMLKCSIEMSKICKRLEEIRNE